LGISVWGIYKIWNGFSPTDYAEQLLGVLMFGLGVWTALHVWLYRLVVTSAYIKEKGLQTKRIELTKVRSVIEKDGNLTLVSDKLKIRLHDQHEGQAEIVRTLSSRLNMLSTLEVSGNVAAWGIEHRNPDSSKQAKR
jgi:hypothetical protein